MHASYKEKCLWISLTRNVWIVREYLELWRVKESKNDWHGHLGHEEEEWADKRNGHHLVKIDQKVATKLRQYLNGCGAWDSLVVVRFQCPFNLTCVLYA
jgi:hypothetical protein